MGIGTLSIGVPPEGSVSTLGKVARMPTDVVTMDKIVALCKRRGFIFPSSEIYGGLGSTYDYGHYGVLLKRNVNDAWWDAMLQERDDIVALDSAILQHPKIWEASGHLAGFTDPLVDCKTCKHRFRADHLEAREDPDSQPDIRCGKRASKLPGDTDDATSPRRASSTSCSRRRSAPSRAAASASTCAPRPRRASSSTSRTS